VKSSTNLPASRREAAWRPLRQQRTKLEASLASALEAVWGNRLRSLLTTLGIVIGISAVIAVFILAQGVNAYFVAQFSQLGTTVLTIQPNTFGSGGSPAGSLLSAADVQVMGKLQHVAGVSPVITIGSQVIYGNKSWYASVEGVASTYQSMSTWSLSEGNWWSQNDEQLGLPVIVLGQAIVKNTFGLTGTDPINRIVRLNFQLYRVVGVLASGGSLSQDQDDTAFIPYTNLLHIGSIPFNTMLVQVDSVDNINLVQQEVTLALEQIVPGGQSSLTVSTPQQLIDQENQSSAALENLLVSLATISLVVGGIGIMNIMLVSVTERTREIGLRVAVGAQPSDIRNQFLVEALILCAIGGGIAVPFGLGTGFLLTRQFGFPYIPNLLAILLAIGVAAAVGLGFGFYPAVRAARLNPIVALRSE